MCDAALRLTMRRCFATQARRGGFAARIAQQRTTKEKEKEKSDSSSSKSADSSKEGSEIRIAPHVQRELAYKQSRRKKPQRRNQQKRRNQTMIMPREPSAKSLSNAMQCRTVDVLKTMIKLGERPQRANEPLEPELAEMIATDRGFKVQPAPAIQTDEVMPRAPPSEADYAALPKRPAVVCIMGHIDHGKTTLLDALRKTNVVDEEAGGITQAIGAFSVELSGGEKITFLDTPGHFAFQQMRERGASMTDIAILIVSAKSGIQDQTLLSLQTLRAANAPFIVAVTKCDLPESKPDDIALEFTKHDVVSEEMGGDVPFVQISAKTGKGLDELEAQLLMSIEALDLRADQTPKQAEGVVVEANTEVGLGTVASVVIKRGALNTGDVVVCGQVSGKIRAIVDDKGNTVKTAYPGYAVQIDGWKGLPAAGDLMLAVPSEKIARKHINAVQHATMQKAAVADFARAAAEATERRKTRTDLLEAETAFLSEFDARRRGQQFKASLQALAGDSTEVKEDAEWPKQFSVILKAASSGALEAARDALEQMPTDEDVNFRVVQTDVGEVTEADVELAKPFGAELVLFELPNPPARIRNEIERHNIEMARFDVIYHMLDYISEQISALMRPRETIDSLGKAQVQQLFEINSGTSRSHVVTGVRVTSGMVQRGCYVRVVARDGNPIEEESKFLPENVGIVKGIRHLKETVKEMKSGTECGLAVDRLQTKEGDELQFFNVKEISRKLGDPKPKPSVVEHLK